MRRVKNLFVTGKVMVNNSCNMVCVFVSKHHSIVAKNMEHFIDAVIYIHFSNSV